MVIHVLLTDLTWSTAARRSPRLTPAISIPRFLGMDLRGHLDLLILTVLQRTEMVRWLIGIGVNIEEADAFGQTPVPEAAGYDALECLDLLLKAGADPNIRRPWTVPMPTNRPRERRAPRIPQKSTRCCCSAGTAK